MFLFPVGVDYEHLRRPPLVTFSIIGLCFVVMLFQLLGYKQPDFFTPMDDMVDYYRDHPYLEKPEVLEQWLSRMRPLAGSAGDQHAAPAKGSLQIMREQQVLDGYALAFEVAWNGQFERLLGFIPARANLWNAISYQFVHSSLLHVLMNMILLYLTGSILEDRWRRPFFLGFYLLSGVFGAYLFRLHHGSLDVPLIGASASVSAVMGAFLVRFFKHDLRIGWAFGFAYRGVFEVPTWLAFPAWFVAQLLFAVTFDRLGILGSVAYWAHVWGFVFGVVVAGAVVLTGLEPKLRGYYIEPELQEAHLLETTAAMARRGETGEALDALSGGHRRYPQNVAILEAYWDQAVRLDAADAHWQPGRSLFQHYLKNDAYEAAYYVWRELFALQAGPRFALKTSVDLARRLLDDNHEEAAAEIIRLLLPGLADDADPGLLLDLTACAGAIAPGLGLQAAAVCRDKLQDPKDRKELAGLRKRYLVWSQGMHAKLIPGEHLRLAAAEGVYELNDPQQQKFKPGCIENLSVMAARCLTISKSGVEVELRDQTRRTLGIEQLRALAVAMLEPPEGGARWVCDLLLDDPWLRTSTHRVVRLRFELADLEALTGTVSEPALMWRQLADPLLGAADIDFLPTNQQVAGNPFASFENLKTYERYLYGVG